jgi:hypothetical protein
MFGRRRRRALASPVRVVSSFTLYDSTFLGELDELLSTRTADVGPRAGVDIEMEEKRCSHLVSEGLRTLAEVDAGHADLKHREKAKELLLDALAIMKHAVPRTLVSPRLQDAVTLMLFGMMHDRPELLLKGRVQTYDCLALGADSGDR